MSILDKIKNCWSSKKIKVLCLQGPSTAGKTYLSKQIEDLLVSLNKKVLVISLDNYYFSRKGAIEYDFDNPAAFNWQAIFTLLDQLNREAEYISMYEYCFQGSISIGPINVVNPKPEFIIIDGIYSLYLFSSFFFDLKHYSPTKTCDSIFTVNTKTFDNLQTINVMLTTCKEQMYSVRLRRDFKERGISKEEIIFQLNNQVWPATVKWVFNQKLKVDLFFYHGTFNEMQLEAFKAAMKIFVSKNGYLNTNKCLFYCRECGKSEESLKLQN